ncbi:SRPBCC family protein [Nocardioides coralli]|uniref:SRPBCC family protein n=1 Tax=Nocardioides coralli TaxID=2872154 RepID=UPI001CA42E7E|nr:SRPBCC family protein [Nocardioides coralli]QZY29018.1 SRPBCC family protein [Nocardioides coralli]
MIDKLFRPLTGEVTVHMDAPPTVVWDLVSDVTRIGEFSPETFEARWIRGSSGPEVGAQFKGHVRRNGIGPTYWTLCTVTACEPERVFEFAVGNDEVTANNWGYRLEPEAGGTRVTEYFRVQPNLMMRAYWLALGPLRGRTNERGMRTTLERMKAVVES